MGVKEIACLLFSLIDYENLLEDAIKFAEMRKKRLNVKFGPFMHIERSVNESRGKQKKMICLRGDFAVKLILCA